MTNKEDILIIRCDREFKLLLKKIAINRGVSMTTVVVDSVVAQYKDRKRKIKTRIINGD